MSRTFSWWGLLIVKGLVDLILLSLTAEHSHREMHYYAVVQLYKLKDEI